eukprot:TRINITY_DN177_c1_g1_i1.p1 TRINITY_DN177_c1_g1~~TRINITY_DN177_c1_g1_i1.p1  ORF type:complete len:280 (-),score=82.68 TRINITY_DN177_c1_g1_i1:92-931(-)
MDNLELLNEFFSNCHEPKTPKIRSRLISLLYQYQPIIWIQRNESGVVELAYLKKELAQIIQNEYAIKLSSFERKLKEDLGLKVVQTTHGRRNIKLFHTPSKYNSNDSFMESSFVSSTEFNLTGVNRGGNRSREISPERTFSQQNKFDIGSIVNPMSNVSISTSPRGNNNGMQNTSPRIIQNSPPRSLISQSPPRSIKESPPFNHHTTFIPQTNFNMNINGSNFFPLSDNNNNNNGFQSNSFSNNTSPRENNSGRSSPNRNLSFNEYEAAMCLTNMKTFF